MSAEDTIDKPKSSTEAAEAVAKAIQADEAPQPADAGETFDSESGAREVHDAERLTEVRARLSEGQQEAAEQVEAPEGEVPAATTDSAKEEAEAAETHALKQSTVQSMEDFIEDEDDRLSERALRSGSGTFAVGATGAMVGTTLLGFSAPAALIAMPITAGLAGIGVWGYMKWSGKRKVRKMRDDAAAMAKSIWES